MEELQTRLQEVGAEMQSYNGDNPNIKFLEFYDLDHNMFGALQNK